MNKKRNPIPTVSARKPGPVITEEYIKPASTAKIRGYRKITKLYCNDCREIHNHHIYKIAIGLGKECSRCGIKESYKTEREI